MLGALLLTAVALADPSSADIELVNPTFSPGSLPGVDAAWATSQGTIRAGVLLQYAADPLVYSEEGEELGSAVANRFTTQVGASWSLTPRLLVRTFIPLVGQWGADGGESAANGAGVGDFGIGGRLALLPGDRLGVALHTDLRFPTGTSRAWLGEAGLRGTLGARGSYATKRLDLLGGAAFAGRNIVSTGDDFTLGSELHVDAAVRYHILFNRLAVHVGAVSRFGLGSYVGPAEIPAEAMLGAQWSPIPLLQIDAGVGHGISSGYGSSRFRAIVGVTFHRAGPGALPGLEPVEEPVIVAASPPPPPQFAEPPAPVDPCPPVVVEPEAPEVEQPKAPVAWSEDELARIDQDQIIIRDPVRFAVGTARILPMSLPILDAVARTMLEHPEILELVIEGHASNEGEFGENFVLSMARATTVFQSLIERGVDAQRLALRGLGEVAPASEDQVYNRRVVFHIVQRARSGETKPEPVLTPVPWTGEKAQP